MDMSDILKKILDCPTSALCSPPLTPAFNNEDFHYVKSDRDAECHFRKEITIIIGPRSLGEECFTTYEFTCFLTELYQCAELYSKEHAKTLVSGITTDAIHEIAVKSVPHLAQRKKTYAIKAVGVNTLPSNVPKSEQSFTITVSLMLKVFTNSSRCALSYFVIS